MPDIAHYCAHCGKSLGVGEAAEAAAKAATAAGATIETRYVPGHPGIAIVKLAGSCDAAQVKKLSMELATLRNDDPKIVIFDLSGADLICSNGLSQIISFVSDREDGREKSTALVNVRDTVRQVIDCLGIGGMLPMYPTIKDALIALRSEA
jgi:anti-anti-sigma factor